MEELLNEVGQSDAFKQRLCAQYAEHSVKDFRLRETRVQIQNGSWITYNSFYARTVDNAKKIDRYLSREYWGIKEQASLAYRSIASAYSVINISFAIGFSLLTLVGIRSSKSRLRKLAISLACSSLERGDSILLSESESLVGKRVLIGFDGGRSRMREDTGKRNKRGNKCYHTPWREPKVMVVQVIDEQGKIERKRHLPIYLATMSSTKKSMTRLAQLLAELNIQQAEHIQFIADGARSIWTNIVKIFRKLELDFSKVTLTLDYYHAVQHLHELVSLLGDKTQQNVDLAVYKKLLWQGKITAIIDDFQSQVHQAKLKLTKAMKTQLKYLRKHRHRMKYSLYKRRKLLCGSGLVESTVRRVVNLRFKGTSCFWKYDNLEKLLFLRCAFLAGRWDNLLKANQLQEKNLRTK